MGFSCRARAGGLATLSAALLIASSGCDHQCGLGERDRVTVTAAQSGPAPANGGAAHQDISLKGATSDAEFSLSNVAMPAEAGGVDAYLVPTTCDRLFDGDYPGGTPFCKIYLGPAKPGGVSPRAKLDPGTYRLFLQGYSSVTSPVNYFVDVYIWDYSCGPLIQ